MEASVAPEAAPVVRLLAHDADLAAAVPAHERDRAMAVLTVPAVRVESGDAPLRSTVTDARLGLMVVEGFLLDRCVIGNRTSSLLLGPGDILGVGSPSDPLIAGSTSHKALGPCTLAVLDQRVVTCARAWPDLMVAFVDRLHERQARMAALHAVGSQPNVDRRVLGVLWLAATRWGRVAPEGLCLPVPLTHREIGELAGARRSTVTLALAQLDQEGQLRRRAGGDWLLERESWRLLSAAGCPVAAVGEPAEGIRPPLRAV